jgi:predicted RNA-binding protein YlqC (UPF0109 family)
MSTIDETLKFLLQNILPSEEVTVETITENDFTRLTIAAPPELVGQIIGKEGRIIKAIRTLLSLSYPNQKFSLEIKD